MSYGQAKQALEYSGGNLLDALIYLEEQGAIPRPQGGLLLPHELKRLRLPPRRNLSLWARRTGRKRGKEKKFKGVGVKVVSGKTLFETLRRWLIDNELEIWRRGQPVTSLPIGQRCLGCGIE